MSPNVLRNLERQLRNVELTTNKLVRDQQQQQVDTLNIAVNQRSKSITNLQDEITARVISTARSVSPFDRNANESPQNRQNNRTGYGKQSVPFVSTQDIHQNLRYTTTGGMDCSRITNPSPSRLTMNQFGGSQASKKNTRFRYNGASADFT
mgnify:CR=1 FL=1|jgi:hypothetical protein